MLVSFPAKVHKLLLAKEIPRYCRFSEKGLKTSQIQKLHKLIHLASI